ncbi:MAG: site-specific DNA-methyltransferase [Phycisphaeraceae bacterium]|nr:site-specific DNA-methyltransferase [Phycisphaeraceae bacterium]
MGRELSRVAKPGAIAAVVIQDQTIKGAKSLTSFRWAVDWVDSCGWRLFETCIYQRNGVPGGYWRKRFRVDHEYILLFVKGSRPLYFDKSKLQVPCKTYAPGATDSLNRRLTSGGTLATKVFDIKPTKCRGTVWSFKNTSMEGNRLKTTHPATFPDKLAADLICCFCPAGGIVLDPMMGSGTTCVQSAIYGRRYCGIDIAAEYVQLAEKRLALEVPPEVGI